MRRWRRVAGGKTGRRESDEEQDREGETACLKSEVQKATTCLRKSILLKTQKLHWQNQDPYSHSKLNWENKTIYPLPF